MPTYVYRCQSCGSRFEAWQKITDEPLTVCPTCSGEVHRVLFAPAISFKGSGFYITDNGSGASPASSESSSSTTETAAESKSEKKPAPKVETAPPASSAAAS